MSMILSKEEWHDAEEEVLDEETGMTRADLLEWQFGDGLEILY